MVESSINQWSIYWLPAFLALEIGLIDRTEKKDTQYKMIVSSPISLQRYEWGRIINGVFISGVMNIVFIILVILISFVTSLHVAISYCIFAIVGIFVTTVWEIPLFYWIARKTNLYVGIVVALVGSIIGILLVDTKVGIIFPFNWSAIFPVGLIRVHINGVPLSADTHVPLISWPIIASIILFFILAWLASYSFERQEIKNVN
jgi:ABC-2 type transport system permease protein